MRYSSECGLSSRSDTFCNLRDTMGKETVASRTGRLLIDAIVSPIFNVTLALYSRRLHARVSILFIYIYIYIYVQYLKLTQQTALRKYHRSNIERRVDLAGCRINSPILSLYRKHERYDVWTIRSHYVRLCERCFPRFCSTIIRTAARECDRRRMERGGDPRPGSSFS